MSTTASFSTFVRPPGSPIYSPSGPSLVLPRRAGAARSNRQTALLRDEESLAARRQIAQVLALIRAAEALEPPVPAVDPQAEELARSLQQLESKIAERERAVAEREFRIGERERDLAEAEVLLEHHEALVAAARRMPVVRPVISEEERTALANLKTELDRQDALLRENREALREREKFIEESEQRLFEKVQQQQEKETELEQREEDLKARTRPADATPQAVKREFDEFNE